MKQETLSNGIDILINSEDKDFIRESIKYYSFGENFKHTYTADKVNVDRKELRKLVKFLIKCEECNSTIELENALRTEFYGEVLEKLRNGHSFLCESCTEKKLLPKLDENFNINEYAEEELIILSILHNNPRRNKAYKVIFGSVNPKEHPKYGNFWKIIESLKNDNLIYISQSGKGNYTSVKAFKVNSQIIPFLPFDKKLDWNEEDEKLKEELEHYKAKCQELEIELKTLKSYMKQYAKIISDLAN